MTQTKEQRRLIRLAGAMNAKARRLGVVGTISAVELAVKPKSCFYCGVTLEDGQGTFDHVIPWDRKGTNVSENIVRCCLSCNRRKFTKTPSEFQAHKELTSTCIVCGQTFHPRWAEWMAGRARTCSRSCAGKRRWA